MMTSLLLFAIICSLTIAACPRRLFPDALQTFQSSKAFFDGQNITYFQNDFRNFFGTASTQCSTDMCDPSNTILVAPAYSWERDYELTDGRSVTLETEIHNGKDFAVLTNPQTGNPILMLTGDSSFVTPSSWNPNAALILIFCNDSRCLTKEKRLSVNLGDVLGVGISRLIDGFFNSETHYGAFLQSGANALFLECTSPCCTSFNLNSISEANADDIEQSVQARGGWVFTEKQFFTVNLYHCSDLTCSTLSKLLITNSWIAQYALDVDLNGNAVYLHTLYDGVNVTACNGNDCSNPLFNRVVIHGEQKYWPILAFSSNNYIRVLTENVTVVCNDAYCSNVSIITTPDETYRTKLTQHSDGTFILRSQSSPSENPFLDYVNQTFINGDDMSIISRVQLTFILPDLDTNGPEPEFRFVSTDDYPIIYTDRSDIIYFSHCLDDQCSTRDPWSSLATPPLFSVDDVHLFAPPNTGKLYVYVIGGNQFIAWECPSYANCDNPIANRTAEWSISSSYSSEFFSTPNGVGFIWPSGSYVADSYTLFYCSDFLCSIYGSTIFNDTAASLDFFQQTPDGYVAWLNKNKQLCQCHTLDCSDFTQSSPLTQFSYNSPSGFDPSTGFFQYVSTPYTGGTFYNCNDMQCVTYTATPIGTPYSSNTYLEISNPYLIFTNTTLKRFPVGSDRKLGQPSVPYFSYVTCANSACSVNSIQEKFRAEHMDILYSMFPFSGNTYMFFDPSYFMLAPSPLMFDLDDTCNTQDSLFQLGGQVFPFPECVIGNDNSGGSSPSDSTSSSDSTFLSILSIAGLLIQMLF